MPDILDIVEKHFDDFVRINQLPFEKVVYHHDEKVLWYQHTNPLVDAQVRIGSKTGVSIYNQSARHLPLSDPRSIKEVEKFLLSES